MPTPRRRWRARRASSAPPSDAGRGSSTRRRSRSSPTSYRRALATSRTCSPRRVQLTSGAPSGRRRRTCRRRRPLPPPRAGRRVNDPAVSLPDDVWAAAVELLRTTPDATLVCHVAPDGDALGSMLALARVLRRRGVDVTCTWGDQRWSVPGSYEWLPGIDDVSRPAEVAKTSPTLLVVLD